MGSRGSSPIALVPGGSLALVLSAVVVLLAGCGAAGDGRKVEGTIVPRTGGTHGHEPLSHAQMEAVLEVAGWPEEARSQALRVAGCESAWNPGSRGDAGEWGLFQIHPSHRWRFQSLFGELADPLSPVQNAVVARQIWADEAWEPWTCQPEAGY